MYLRLLHQSSLFLDGNPAAIQSHLSGLNDALVGVIEDPFTSVSRRKAELIVEGLQDYIRVHDKVTSNGVKGTLCHH